MANLRKLICHWLKEIVILSLIILSCLMVFPERANAYIDPGTGSIILQVALGAFVAGLVTIKIFWNRLITWMKKVFRHQGENE